MEGTGRLAEISTLLQRLFEENVAGRMNDDNYTAMFKRYQSEQGQLTKRVQELESQLKRMGEFQDSSRKWVDLIAKYADYWKSTFR